MAVGQVGMCEGATQFLPYATVVGTETQAAIDGRPNGKHVQEEAHHFLPLTHPALRHRRADQYVLLSRHPVQQHLPYAQKYAEQAHPGGLCISLQGALQAFSDPNAQLTQTAGLRVLNRHIRPQTQHPRQVLQTAAPVGFLTKALLPTHQRRLPQRKVGVPERRQPQTRAHRIAPATQQLPELHKEHAHRPRIHDRMVEREKQMALPAAIHMQHPPQRMFRQEEVNLAIRTQQRRQTIRIHHHLPPGERPATHGVDHLQKGIPFHRQTRPEHFMPRRQRLKNGLEQRFAGPRRQRQQSGDMVRRWTAKHLLQHPHAPLSGAHRDRHTFGNTLHRKGGALPTKGLQPRCQSAQTRIRIYIRQRQLYAQTVTHLCYHPQRQQRVTAQ